jgi:hypothetical protein
VRGRTGVVAVLAALAAAGCGAGREPAIAQPLPQEPAVAARWDTTLAHTVALVEAGRYAEADTALTTFAARWAGTAESANAAYWRALLRLDPANPGATARDALVAIDAYLAGGAELPRYDELLVLRRLAGNLERVRLLAAEAERARMQPPVDTSSAIVTRQAEEIQRLRTELERTTAELDRLRRRIRPDPPARPPPR